MLFSRSLFTAGTAFFFTAAALAGSTTEISLFYGQTADLWSTYHGIQDAKNDVARIQSILSSKYGTFEEGVAQASVFFHGIPLTASSGLFRTLYLGVGGYALAMGAVDNPIIPVLHADLIIGSSISVGTEGELSFWPLATRLGVTGGWGSEKRSDASSTDLIDHIALTGGKLGFFGFDQKFAEPAPNPKTKETYRASLEMHETFFHSTIPQDSESLIDENQDFFAFRWKEENEWSLPVSLLEKSRLGLQLIVGQQPIPVDILPRVWDWSHQLPTFPEAGTLVGGGLHLHTYVNAHSLIDLFTGIYAGYFGAGMEWRYRAFNIDLGSWGLEGRSAYLSQGSRLWIARLAFIF